MAQRPIKFRAWWPAQRLMHSWEEMIKSTAFYLNYFMPGLGKPILMQFTGLLDKNGKEIYEGDLVGEPGFYFEVTYFDGAYHIGNSQTLIEWVHARQRRRESTEVIGNVYENPDLLKA